VVGVIGKPIASKIVSHDQMVGEAQFALRSTRRRRGALPLMFRRLARDYRHRRASRRRRRRRADGARANVHPTRFKTEPHERHEPYDIHRDDVALALTEACVARGVPIFGICRGLQEMNVAFGGSLHPKSARSRAA
jgi:putative glutamine amidotransferase